MGGPGHPRMAWVRDWPRTVGLPDLLPTIPPKERKPKKGKDSLYALRQGSISSSSSSVTILSPQVTETSEGGLLGAGGMPITHRGGDGDRHPLAACLVLSYSDMCSPERSADHSSSCTWPEHVSMSAPCLTAWGPSTEHLWLAVLVLSLAQGALGGGRALGSMYPQPQRRP